MLWDNADAVSRNSAAAVVWPVGSPTGIDTHCKHTALTRSPVPSDCSKSADQGLPFAGNRACMQRMTPLLPVEPQRALQQASSWRLSAASSTIESKHTAHLCDCRQRVDSREQEARQCSRQQPLRRRSQRHAEPAVLPRLHAHRDGGVSRHQMTVRLSSPLCSRHGREQAWKNPACDAVTVPLALPHLYPPAAGAAGGMPRGSPAWTPSAACPAPGATAPALTQKAVSAGCIEQGILGGAC